MAVFTLDQARADLAHVGRDFREEDARAARERRRAALLQIGDAIRAVDDVIAHIQEHHLTDQPGGQELLKAGRQPRPGLRVHRVETHIGIWSLTWAPDGRATFRYGEAVRPGEPHMIWRRIGGHEIYDSP